MIFLFKSLCALLLLGHTWGQATMSSEEAAKLKARMVEYCRNSSPGITPEEEDSVLIKRDIPKTKAGGCFVACVLKHVNYMAPNNSLTVQNLQNRLDRTKDQAPPEEYLKKVEILKYCKSKETPEPDECVAAKKFVECCVVKKEELKVTTKLW